MIDLHCHSNYSDGLDSVDELIIKAMAANIKMLALTDHDTLAGIDSLIEAKIKHRADIKIIKGIELTLQWRKYAVHVLGLNLQDTAQLDEIIKSQQQLRLERAKLISAKLEELGVKDAFEKVSTLTDKIPARPHFAQLLVAEKVVASENLAFKNFLGQGKRAYIPMQWPSLEEGIRIINKARGDALLAHPLKYKFTNTKLHEIIQDFVKAQGSGIEVISGAMKLGDKKILMNICNKYKLLASTGSDYHGVSRSIVKLGCQEELPLQCIPIWSKWKN